MAGVLLLDELRGLRPRMVGELQSRGHEVFVCSNPRDLETAAFDADRIEILGLSSTFWNWELPTDFLDSLPQLKGLCISGGWHEYVDLDYCRKRSLRVTYVPGFAGQAAAEWCVMATFALARRLPTFEAGSRYGCEDVLGQEVGGKRAGIVGLGSVGKALLRLLPALGMRCSYWSRTSRDSAYEYLDVNTLVEGSDFLYLTFYEGPALHGFFDRDRLNQMSRDAYLISGLGSQPSLRSEAVDWQHALMMVRNGELAGIAVEAGEDELIPGFEGENVLVTPGHSGWCTAQSLRRGTEVWIQNIDGVLRETGRFLLDSGSEEDGH